MSEKNRSLFSVNLALILSGFVTLENLESSDDIFLVTLIIKSESIATDESTSIFLPLKLSPIAAVSIIIWSVSFFALIILVEDFWSEKISLTEMVDKYPLERGVVDVVCYRVVAGEDNSHDILDNEIVKIDLNRPAQPRFVEVEQLIFQKSSV